MRHIDPNDRDAVNEYREIQGCPRRVNTLENDVNELTNNVVSIFIELQRVRKLEERVTTLEETVKLLQDSVNNLQSLYTVASDAEELAKDSWVRCIELSEQMNKIARQSYINSGEYEP